MTEDEKVEYAKDLDSHKKDIQDLRKFCDNLSDKNMRLFEKLLALDTIKIKPEQIRSSSLNDNGMIEIRCFKPTLVDIQIQFDKKSAYELAGQLMSFASQKDSE